MQPISEEIFAAFAQRQPGGASCAQGAPAPFILWGSDAGEQGFKKKVMDLC